MPEEALLLSVDKTCHLLGLGRTLLYAMLRDGRLEGVKLAGRTLVLRSSVDALVANAPSLSIIGTAK